MDGIKSRNTAYGDFIENKPTDEHFETDEKPSQKHNLRSRSSQNGGLLTNSRLYSTTGGMICAFCAQTFSSQRLLFAHKCNSRISENVSLQNFPPEKVSIQCTLCNSWLISKDVIIDHYNAVHKFLNGVEQWSLNDVTNLLYDQHNSSCSEHSLKMEIEEDSNLFSRLERFIQGEDSEHSNSQFDRESSNTFKAFSCDCCHIYFSSYRLFLCHYKKHHSLQRLFSLHNLRKQYQRSSRMKIPGVTLFSVVQFKFSRWRYFSGACKCLICNQQLSSPVFAAFHMKTRHSAERRSISPVQF